MNTHNGTFYANFNYPLYTAQAFAADGSLVGPCVGQIGIGYGPQADGHAHILRSENQSDDWPDLGSITIREGTLFIERQQRVGQLVAFTCRMSEETLAEIVRTFATTVAGQLAP